MTAPTLSVTAAGLRTLSARCEDLSGQVVPPRSSVTASGWQTSGAAASAVNAGAGSTRLSCKGRALADATKLGTAAHDYTTVDDQEATALTAVAASIPAGAGGDGGTGAPGVPASPIPLFPPLALSGADGGAGGLGGTR